MSVPQESSRGVGAAGSWLPAAAVTGTDPDEPGWRGDPAVLVDARQHVLEAIAGARPPWWSRAACRGMDTEVFFAARGDTASVRAAKAVCATCPVREPCLAEALADPHRLGVFGGTSHRERRVMRRRRAA